MFMVFSSFALLAVKLGGFAFYAGMTIFVDMIANVLLFILIACYSVAVLLCAAEVVRWCFTKGDAFLKGMMALLTVGSFPYGVVRFRLLYGWIVSLFVDMDTCASSTLRIANSVVSNDIAGETLRVLACLLVYALAWYQLRRRRVSTSDSL